MFGRKKREDEQPEPEKRELVDDPAAIEWGPLAQKMVRRIESLQNMQHLPKPFRQLILDAARDDMTNGRNEEFHNAAEFMVAYLTGDVDGAEAAVGKGLEATAFDNGIQIGDLGTAAFVGSSKPGSLPPEVERVMSEGEDAARRRFREIQESGEGDPFFNAWATFSEATGAEVKCISTGTESTDFTFQIELPSGIAHLVHHAVELGAVLIDEKYGDGRMLKAGFTSDTVREMGERLGIDHQKLRLGAQACNLIAGMIAYKGAAGSAEGKYDEEREDMEISVSLADEVWKDALDEAGAPVETPHDMAKYIKWLQNEKAEAERKLAEVNGTDTSD